MTHKHRYEQGYLGKMFSKVRLTEHEAHKLSAPEENSEQEQRDEDEFSKVLKQEEKKLGRKLTEGELNDLFEKIWKEKDLKHGDGKSGPE